MLLVWCCCAAAASATGKRYQYEGDSGALRRRVGIAPLLRERVDDTWEATERCWTWLTMAATTTSGGEAKADGGRTRRSRLERVRPTTKKKNWNRSLRCSTRTATASAWTRCRLQHLQRTCIPIRTTNSRDAMPSCSTPTMTTLSMSPLLVSCAMADDTEQSVLVWALPPAGSPILATATVTKMLAAERPHSYPTRTRRSRYPFRRTARRPRRGRALAAAARLFCHMCGGKLRGSERLR